MKKRNIGFGILLIGLCLLGACGKEGTSVQSGSLSGGNISQAASTTTPSKTNADFAKAKVTYTDGAGNEKPLHMNTIYSNQNAPHLDPLSEQHVMVVPFGFTDANLQQYQKNYKKKV